MLLLELLQNLHLPLLVARRLAHLLLPLVVHHLLDHGARLAVQVAERRRLGHDLGHVDLGRRRHDVRPPLHLVDLVQVDGDFLACGGGLERPGGFVGVDGVGEFTLMKQIKSVCCCYTIIKVSFWMLAYINNRLLPLHPNLDLRLREHNVQILALHRRWHRHRYVRVADRLRPFVGQLGLFGIFFGLAFLLLLFAPGDLLAARAVVDVCHVGDVRI